MFNQIPSELIEYNQWVCWNSAKMPINPKFESITLASVTNSATWGSFAQALEAYERFKLSGIGFVFNKEDPFIGIDIDGCRNPNSREIKAEAMVIANEMGSYTEISPSGKGLHIIVKGWLPFRGKQGDVFEIYGYGRYFTMTGWHYEPTPIIVKERSKELKKLIEKYFPDIVIMKPLWNR